MKLKTIILIIVVILASLINAFAADKVNFGTITPGGRELSIIAIPQFDPETGSMFYKEDPFFQIIYRDLELSGYFLKPKNLKIVDENKKRDKAANNIDFAEWKRLGASFLLNGTYFVDNEKLEVEVILYDVASGKRIFGKRFKNFKPIQLRIAAHKISDEIVHYITHIKGIANTKILFVSTRSGNKEIWVMDADGYNQVKITKDKSLATAPCWGKNATEIYYTSFKEYNPDLCGTFLDGSKSWFISSFPGLNVSAAWADKIERLAITLSKDGNSEIYTMDRTGKNSKRLTFNNSIESSPVWSPQGNEIAFTSDRTGTPQIYVMNSEGFNVRRLTFQGNYNDGAAWSPKGDKIAFHARSEGYFNIFIMNVDGSDWVQLTYRNGNNEDPSWAPDGQHIVFTSDRNNRKQQIFIMNIDGTGQTQLTFDGTNISPAWSPYLD